MQAAFCYAHFSLYPSRDSNRVLQVNRLDIDDKICQQIASSGIQLPCIVKPRVACGTPEAHHMALILRSEGFQAMQVRIVGCVVLQEHAEHTIGML